MEGREKSGKESETAGWSYENPHGKVTTWLGLLIP